MKLDPSVLRYITKNEFRVLTAVEVGQKNHEIVPVPLITAIANLRNGGVAKLLNNLLRHKLLHHETQFFDGYRLTNLGYDYLALKAFLSRKTLTGVGRQIGVGKESDIFIVVNKVEEEEEEENEVEVSQRRERKVVDLSQRESEKVQDAINRIVSDQTADAREIGETKQEEEEGQEQEDMTGVTEFCLKVHRLGRTSFRNVKNKRDYHKSRKSPSWLYLSRLAAKREYDFMQVLYQNNFPVPTPIDQNRHAILMSLVDGYLLNTVRELDDQETIERLYRELMTLIERFGRNGLIHGDFNEFNLMISEAGKVTVIDFPQMMSIDHENAKMYFERDVNCIKRFFDKRFNYVNDYVPAFEQVVSSREGSLDKFVEATGFVKMSKVLQRLSLEGATSEQEVEGDDVSDKSEPSTSSETETPGNTLRQSYEAVYDTRIQQKVDRLQSIVKKESKKTKMKRGTRKALKMSRNQVKNKNRRTGRLVLD